MNNHVRAKMKQIVEAMKEQVHEQAKPKLIAGANFLVRVVLSEMQGFFSVTGNTRNSIAVALFYNGNIEAIATSFDELHHAPTRMTLVSGEVYDLPYYWDGSPVDSGRNSHPYAAPDDSGAEDSFWAQEEAFEFVQSKAPRHKGWSYIVVSAVDYAKYLETNNKANVLTNVRDYLASLGAEVSELGS